MQMLFVGELRCVGFQAHKAGFTTIKKTMAMARTARTIPSMVPRRA
jgi:hypothetical protein